MPPTITLERIAAFLASDFHKHGFPKDNKPLAWAQRFDGSLSVVAANGQKLIFSKEMIEKARQELTEMEENKAAKPPGRPRKATQKAPGEKKQG